MILAANYKNLKMPRAPCSRENNFDAARIYETELKRTKGKCYLIV